MSPAARDLARALGVVLLVAAFAGMAHVILRGDDPALRARPTAPPASPRRPPPELRIGLSELNAHLLWSTEARPQAPAGFGPWRDRVQALRPDYYRLFVDWAKLQPDPARRADLALPADGCLRGAPPCAPFSGFRDVFDAVTSQQREHRGFEVLMVIYGVPDWAAAPPSGCERPGTEPRSRAISDDGLRGYRALVADLLALARTKGVALRYWSPWNEPNHPFFISPQRATCDRDAPALSPAVYTRITHALEAELAQDSARHDLVLGELAGFPRSRPNGASISQFVGALPDDVVCAGPIWSQHQYSAPGEDPYDKGVVGKLEAALARRHCPRAPRLWITETGTGGTRSGAQRARSPAALRRGCRAQAAALRRWAKDPQIDAAFQYTFREDPAFPVALADQGLTRAYPTYDLWRELGRDGRVNPERCRASATAADTPSSGTDATAPPAP